MPKPGGGIVGGGSIPGGGIPGGGSSTMPGGGPGGGASLPMAARPATYEAGMLRRFQRKLQLPVPTLQMLQ